MSLKSAAFALVSLLVLGRGAARADAVLDWNAIMVATVASQNPFAQARFAAITQLAVFEAVNATTGEYKPYLGTIAAQPSASPDAAAIAAAHAVLRNYFPANATVLDAARASSLADIPDGPAKTDGIAAGEAAAAAMITLRTSDGSAPPQFYTPSSAAPGRWQPTAGCPAAGGILLHWPNVRPFGILSSKQFRTAPPPRLAGSHYRRNFDEVKKVGGATSALRPGDRAEVALFYNAVLAVEVWNHVARQVSAAKDVSISENARTFALMNMAISDALVSVMETKYHYVFWRPATAIPAADRDRNRKTDPDVDFVPFVPTPCFPSYPSAHASASYAARTVLHELWGDRGASIELTHPSLPNVILHYTSYQEITQDIDDARVYGGIHFRFDQEAGAKQGTRIGRYVVDNNLSRVRKW